MKREVLTMITSTPGAQTAPTCSSPDPTAPMQVTGDCIERLEWKLE